VTTKWDPQNLIKAAKQSGVKYAVDSTWLKVDPYPTSFSPVGVVWHHTGCGSLSRGNMPSLNWCRNPGVFTGKARACHIVVGRDGFMQIIAGNGAYHAGAGGPLKVNGTWIKQDLGNQSLIGFEIEASSTTKINKKNVQTPKWGMNPAQFEAVSAFCAALFDIMDWDTSAAIRHKDWTTRKIDVGIPLESIRAAIKAKRAKPPVIVVPPVKPPAPAKPIVRLKNVQPRVTHDDVSVVRKALAKEFGVPTNPDKPHYFGVATKAQYKKWQKKLGYTGTDADGIPGKESLVALGKKHGFTVRTP
jgi:N-acetylmuramoyl-L-alanine amidase